jgi:heterodisulfide reductase subunit C
MVDATTKARAPTLFDIVVGITPGETNLDKCIQCGTCSGSCPSGPDMDYSPRALFAMINAGMKEQVLRSNTHWYCVSCYYCMVRCPQDVHVTDIMYSLKRLAIKEGFYQSDSRTKDASGFSETFIDYVENYGRSFELGLATRYHLLHHPLNMPKMAPMALGMFSKGRMSITPKRIKNLDQLKAILKKASELEDEMYSELEA